MMTMCGPTSGDSYMVKEPVQPYRLLTYYPPIWAFRERKNNTSVLGVGILHEAIVNAVGRYHHAR